MQKQQMIMQQQDFLRFQLDATQQLQEMMMDLMGYTYNEDKDEYFKDPSKETMINLRGTNAVMTFVRPRITKIFSLSNHSDEEISKECEAFATDIMFLMCRHMQEYQVISYPVMNLVIDTCDDLFKATMQKSRLGWEGDSIRKGHQTVESRETVINQEPKRGIFQNLFPK